MAVFDTPLTTDSAHIAAILNQKLPVMLVLHEDQRDKPLEDALSKVARKHKGNLLVAKVDVRENADLHAKHNHIATPAIISYDANGKILAQANYVRPADVRQHTALLINGTPIEAPQSQRERTSSEPINVSDKTWRDEVLKSNVPVLVDFWAPWCGPCRSIAPYVEQLAKEYAGRLKVVKLNTDNNPVISRRHGIQGIPTLAIFENGQQVNRISGANPAGLKRMVEQALA